MDPVTLTILAALVFLVLGGTAAVIETGVFSMRLNAGQIRQYAAQAGFAGGDLDVAVAVALAESAGKTDAHGDLTLGNSYGLWQINLRWHPEYTAEQLTDPQTNANAAFAIYNAAGQSFQPWTTFKTGNYLAYLGTGSSTAA